MKNIVLCLFISISIDLIAFNNEISGNRSNSEKSKLKELEINNKYKIEPNDLRLNLLREYTKKHYGEACIYLNNPQIIVIHSTEIENVCLDSGYNTPAICKKIEDSEKKALMPYSRPKGRSRKTSAKKYAYESIRVQCFCRTRCNGKRFFKR